MSNISDTASNLANNMIYLRKSRNLTQAKLSELSEIPRSTITHFESGSGNPSLTNLVKIANALEVQVEELLAPPMKAQTVFIKNGNFDHINKGNCLVYNLLPHPIKGLELERFEFEVNSGFTGVPHLKGTKEYFTIIQGKAQIIVAGEKFIVEKGDILIFEGNEKHSYQNLSKSKTIGISILVKE